MSVREVSVLTQIVTPVLALLLCACPGLSDFLDNDDVDDGDRHTWPAEFDPARSLVSVAGDGVAAANGVDNIRIRVLVRDAQGNGVSGLRVTLESTGSDTLLVQPDLTDSAGTTSGSVASTRAETKTITALVETALGPIRLPTRPRVTFVPGEAAALAFAVEPGSAQAGTVLRPAVEVMVTDAFGNALVDASHDITVSLAESSLEVENGDASLTGTTTRAAVGGVASFNDLSIDRASDTHRLLATSDGLLPAESGIFSITLGPPAHLEFLDSPTTGVVGQPLSTVRVALQDASGNTLLSGSAPVTLALSGHPGLLKGPLVAHPNQGVAEFEGLQIPRPGTDYVLIATASGFAGAQSDVFTIAPAPPASLKFETQPGNAGAGRPFENPVRVVLLNEWGERAVNADDEVSLSLLGGDPAALLLGTTSVTAIDGVAEFVDVAVDLPGADYILLASAAGVGEAESAPFHVTSNPPPLLAFSGLFPESVVAGEVLDEVTVLLLDDLGAALPDSLTQVTLEAIGGPELLGTTTATAVDGVVAFSDLHFETAATDVRLAARAPDFVGVESDAFAVLPASPATVVFSQEPRSAAPGESIGPVVVDVLDRFGNRTNATGAVTLSLSGGTSPATLDVPDLIETVNGRAQFDSPTVDTRGVGYRLIASAAGFGQQGDARERPGAPFTQESAPFHIGVTHDILVADVLTNGDDDGDEGELGNGASNHQNPVDAPADDDGGNGDPGDGDPGDGEPGDGEPGDGEPGDGEPGDGEPDDGDSIFTPRELTLYPGEAVRWVFVDGPHTITSGEGRVADHRFCSPDNRDCDEAAESFAGDEYVHRFLEVGSYVYFSRSQDDGGEGLIRVVDED